MSMSLLIPLIISVLAAIIAIPLMNKAAGAKNESRKRAFLKQVGEETDFSHLDEPGSALKDDSLSGSKAYDALLKIVPKAERDFRILRKAGFKINVATLTLIRAAIGFVTFGFLSGVIGMMPVLAIIFAVIAGTIGVTKYILYRVEKRSLTFINMFPDAVDMIVRSVRSGHPLSAALKMISENMDSPIKEEFVQVVDEIAYGRSVTEALNVMSERVEEPDVRFFVVVVNVQQETGGNLGEVLSNLANILRQRKQMRMKIHALTSEGRMTAYILGSLPFFVIGILHILSPDYLVPLFENRIGNFILGLAGGMVFAAFYITRKMVKIDI